MRLPRNGSAEMRRCAGSLPEQTGPVPPSPRPGRRSPRRRRRDQREGRDNGGSPEDGPEAWSRRAASIGTAPTLRRGRKYNPGRVTQHGQDRQQDEGADAKVTTAHSLVKSPAGGFPILRNKLGQSAPLLDSARERRAPEYPQRLPIPVDLERPRGSPRPSRGPDLSRVKVGLVQAFDQTSRFTPGRDTVPDAKFGAGPGDEDSQRPAGRAWFQQSETVWTTAA